MIELAIDSTSKTAAAGVRVCGASDQIKSETFSDSGLTHSQTLMPMILAAFEKAGIKPSDCGVICVTAGPGSFTGVRIGMSAAKGIAMGCGAKIKRVSPLESLALNYEGDCGRALLCPSLDARRNQIYNSLFLLEKNKVARICGDRAISAEELAAELSAYNLPVILIGDGSHIVNKAYKRGEFSPPNKNYITAKTIFAASESVRSEDHESAVPVYLRLSQAQREYTQNLNSGAQNTD